MSKRFHILLGLTIGFFALNHASFADIPPFPNQEGEQEDPRIYYEWAMGSPALLKSANACSSVNVCTGQYRKIIPGFHGVVEIGNGLAYCNSLPNGSCPKARDCKNEPTPNLNIDFQPKVESKMVKAPGGFGGGGFGNSGSEVGK